MKVIIVGGVAGGATAAARLRRLDETAEIILLERGEFISFANCGLPYYIGGDITDKRMLTLQTPESFHARFHVDVRVHHEATGINPNTKTLSIVNLQTGAAYTERYDSLLLSPGAAPITPPIPGTELPNVFTLRNIPDTMRIKAFLEQRQPKTATILGGGYIGLELAENLKKAGLDVTVVEQAAHLIAPLDFDMAAQAHAYLTHEGIHLMLNNSIQAICEDSGTLRITLDKGTHNADILVIAAGVRPETALAQACGIRTNSRGAILVNAHMQTSEPDIYAVGDAVAVTNFVTGVETYLPLAGPANKQGRIAADNICGLRSTYAGSQGSAVLKLFGMAVAATGLNEHAAHSAGIAYDKTYLYAPSHATYYPGASNMCVKAIWDKKTLRLLGAQIVGFDGVDKRMDVLAAAIRFGAKVTELAQLELCYAPPYGSAKDPVNMLGFVAENIATGKVKQFFWDEADALPRDGSVTLLDVRTAAEVAHGKMDGFLHIPLNNLRSHMAQIPPDKPVYVHCHSGLRSYIACRILTGYGYDCYNLAGGWQFYTSAMHAKAAPGIICPTCP